eukprot:3935027-Rhodomonas_salina.2
MPQNHQAPVPLGTCIGCYTMNPKFGAGEIASPSLKAAKTEVNMRTRSGVPVGLLCRLGLIFARLAWRPNGPRGRLCDPSVIFFKTSTPSRLRGCEIQQKILPTQEILKNPFCFVLRCFHTASEIQIEFKTLQVDASPLSIVEGPGITHGYQGATVLESNRVCTLHKSKKMAGKIN